ncbi:FAD-binding oxidoreductase [Steroidobacter cummioxidans]|uniref:NAD(P)/FAD-dependent oxidoreductase n=1 Tax=Steroidobacter cummioxidans TaxID=1803913 RepID=UPI002AC351F7|nr:FAD-binding oxidoreductase [Steroidobacter cummioxidans]
MVFMTTAKKPTPKTAVVIGGGIVGLACAVNLQNSGVQTTLIDPQRPHPASWGNAGHIAVEQVEPLANPATLRTFHKRLFWRGGALSLPPADIGTWLPFALRFVQASRPAQHRAGKVALGAALSAAWPAWRKLVTLADVPSLLLEDGHYVVWETPKGAAAGRAAWERADIGSTSIRDVTTQEMDSLAARMARPPAGAIRFSGSGQILDLGELANSVRTRFNTLGGTLLREKVHQIQTSSNEAVLVTETGQRHSADAVVVSAGVASAPLLSGLGYRVPIIAERGYHIHSALTDWPLGSPPVVFEERSMIVTRFASGLRAASFVEFARADSSPDPRKWRRLRKHVIELGLSLHDPLSEWMGARPTLPDYLPAIGRSRRSSNLYYAFGHQHLGLTLAAATGEAMGALVRGDHPQFDLAPFDIERFS